MGVSSSQDLCYYVLCVVREPVGESTVNLKCPIVIHAEEKKSGPGHFGYRNLSYAPPAF